MSLQICGAAGCKTITLLDFCDEHVDPGESWTDEEQETLRSRTPEPANRLRPTEVDLVNSVMSAVRQHAAPVPQEERAMTATSPDRQCTFITIRGTRCSQASMKGATVCKPHLVRAPQPSNTLPATRPRAPIALADPIVVNPPATNGQVSFAGIDALIANAEQDLAALKRVRVIVERESYEDTPPSV